MRNSLCGSRFSCVLGILQLHLQMPTCAIQDVRCIAWIRSFMKCSFSLRAVCNLPRPQPPWQLHPLNVNDHSNVDQMSFMPPTSSPGSGPKPTAWIAGHSCPQRSNEAISRMQWNFNMQMSSFHCTSQLSQLQYVEERQVSQKRINSWMLNRNALGCPCQLDGINKEH